MTLIPLTCTNCGAKLEVNDALERGFCNYCGHSFLISEAIAQKIIIDESHKLESLLNLAEAELSGKNYGKCIEHCDAAILIDSKNHKAWYMKGCASEEIKPGSGKYCVEKANSLGGNYTYKPNSSKQVTPSKTAPSERKFRIYIDKSNALLQPKVNIYVDKKLVAQIKCGEMEVTTIAPGKHTISLKQNMATLMAWKQTIIVENKDVSLKLAWNKQKKGYDFALSF